MNLSLGGVTITPNLLLFGGLASSAAVCAVGVVAFNNAIRSALCLVINFFLLAVVYFTLQAEMLGITQVIVYTGAIMVLFLFVIMLLNIGAPLVLHEKLDPKKYFGVLLGFGLFALIGSQVLPPLLPVTQTKALPGYGSAETVGRAIFTLYAFPFEAVSFLLLIGVVGSILLAKRRIH